MSSPQTVLVTCGAGIIGSHVAEFYADRGADVIVLDNLSRVERLATADDSRDTAAYNWVHLLSFPEVEFVRGDIRDADRLDDIVEGHDAIIHTAGQVAVTASLENPRTDFQVNADGTINVPERARKAESNPGMVLASTNRVYGDIVNDIPVVEGDTRYGYDDPEFADGIPERLSIDWCEHTPYGTSKLAVDLYIHDYAKRGVLDAAAFRMS